MRRKSVRLQESRNFAFPNGVQGVLGDSPAAASVGISWREGGYPTLAPYTSGREVGRERAPARWGVGRRVRPVSRAFNATSTNTVAGARCGLASRRVFPMRTILVGALVGALFAAGCGGSNGNTGAGAGGAGGESTSSQNPSTGGAGGQGGTPFGTGGIGGTLASSTRASAGSTGGAGGEATSGTGGAGTGGAGGATSASASSASSSAVSSTAPSLRARPRRARCRRARRRRARCRQAQPRRPRGASSSAPVLVRRSRARARPERNVHASDQRRHLRRHPAVRLSRRTKTATSSTPPA